MDAIEEFRYLVLAAQREGARALTAALKEHDLTPSQAEAIAVLRDAQRPLTVREVGDRLVCEGGSPSRLMATLNRKGLVQSSGSSQDRRTTPLSLTDKGTTAARAVGHIEQDLYAALALVLSDSQLNAALPVLRDLVAQLPAGQALQRRIDDRGSVTTGDAQ
jgi:DNA-binding MarR family transcriptional regulator